MYAIKHISRVLALTAAIVPWTMASAATSQVKTSIGFTTAAALEAPVGMTALSGRVLATDGTPLRDVLLRDGTVETLSDRDGRFLLQGVADADSVLVIDGRASHDKQGITDYGYYEARVHAELHKTTALPFTSYLPKVDHRHEVTIASPTTNPVIVTTPAIPGLELRIPAGAILTDTDGKPVTKVGITPIPVDRTPFPLPKNVQVPIYFTAQPGGAVITAADGSWKGAQVVYPNYHHDLPNARGTFWRYDPDNLGWTAYGVGSVTPDGQQVTPDEHTQMYALTGAMLSTGRPRPATGPSPGGPTPPLPGNDPGAGPNAAPANPGDGDPVDLGTGLFVQSQTDLRLNDVVPLELKRTYRPGDYNRRSFGVGMTLNYEMYLSSTNQYQVADLVMPDGGLVHYTRIPNNPPSNGYTDANFVTSSPSIFNQSHVTWNGNGWNLALKDGSLYVFGENAPLQYVQDRFGNRTSLTRQGGPNGPVIQVTSPNGHFIAFTYDPTNTYITKAVDNAGRTVGYGYDTNGRLTTVTDPDAGITTYTWDTSNRVSSIQDANKHTFVTLGYDANDRVQTQTLADGAVHTFAYTLNASGGVTETDTTDGRNVVRKTTFDAAGNIVTDNFAVGTPVEEDWSLVRDPTTELPLSETDPLGRTTSYTYDANGNLLTRTTLSGTANAATTTFTYAQPFNTVATVTDPLGHITTIQPNSVGLPASITDPLTHVWSFTYNPAGQILTSTDPLNHIYRYAYDHGDLVTVTDPLGYVSKVFIDTVGRPVQATNPLGQTTSQAFDAIKGPSQTIDANGAATAFTYDAVGKLAKLTDARNGITSYAFDTRNRLTVRTDPLLATDTVTSYDPNGNPLTGKDRKGQAITNTYDPLNRLATSTYADGTVVTYTRDLGNRLTKIQDSSRGTISWTYDGRGSLASETTSLGTVSYTYDAAERPATKTIPGQAVITYSFDNADRLTKVVQGGVTTSFVYDNGNRLAQKNLPNSIVEAYALDKSGNLTSINVTRLGTTLGTLLYTYDSANRMSTRSGTLFQSILPAAVISATYNAANRLTQWVTPTGTTSPTWDGNGNLTNDGTRTYSWDVRNSLSGITGVASYSYDAVGRRSGITQASTTRGFLYDGDTAVQESTGGTVTANLIGSGGTDSRFTRAVVGGATSTYITDALGSTVALADGTGTVQTRYGYDPYGNTSTTGAANTSTYGFTGRENDGTGLYYLRARYYNPAWGRFISEDPIGLNGGWNRYQYANSSPTRFYDPNGHNSIAAGAGIGFEVGGPVGFVVGGVVGAGILYCGVTSGHCGLGGGSDTGSSAGAPAAPSAPATATPAPGDPAPGCPDYASCMAGKPDYKPNPAHDPQSGSFNPNKDPEPSDAQDLYKQAVSKGDGKTWFAQNPDGSWYRYFGDNQGGAHYSGTVPPERVPIDIRRGWK